MKTQTVPRPPNLIRQAGLALALTAILAPLPVSRADAGTFYSGAKIIANVYSGLIGKTTVTPAQAIHRWARAEYGYYRNHPYGTWLIAERDRAGNYSYYTFRRDEDNRWVFMHEKSFPIRSLRIWNHFCDRSVTNPDGTVVRYTTRIVEVFDVAVWAANVVRTGFWSPSGPFETHLLSTTTALHPSCVPVAPTTSDVRSRPFYLPLSGTVVVRMPIVNRCYAWPMYCWIGKFYHGL